MKNESEGQSIGISEKSADMLDTLLSHYVSGSLPVPLASARNGSPGEPGARPSCSCSLPA